MTSPKTLILDESHFIAEGQGRLVFHHPDDKNLVVKIQKKRKVKRFNTLRRMFSRNKRRFLPILFSWVEIDEYAAMAARHDKVPKFCVQFRGFANTNKGLGAIFDAVLTPDGTIAPTLAQLAKTQEYNEDIITAIDQFWDEAEKFDAVIWDSHAKNVLVSGSLETEIALVLVDGLGERTLVPLRTMSKSIRKSTNVKSRAAMKREYTTLSERK